MNENQDDHVRIETEPALTHPGEADEYQVRVDTSRAPSGRKRRIDRRLHVLATSPGEAVQAAIGWLLRTREAAGNATARGTSFHVITTRGEDESWQMTVEYGASEEQDAARRESTYEARRDEEERTRKREIRRQQKPAQTSPETPTPSAPAAYDVELLSQAPAGGEEMPIGESRRVEAIDPKTAAETVVREFRKELPGLTSTAGRRMRYQLNVMRPPSDGQSYEGWEIEVTYDPQASNTVAAAPERTTTVH